MKKSTTFYQDVIKGGYDIRSGVYSIQDANISMQLDKYGEYRYTNEELLKNPELAKISAMSDESLNEDEVSKGLYANVPSIQHHSMIGYYSGLYAGHVAEGNFRKNASSGGLTTWLLCKLLENDMIDGVIHAQISKKKGLLFEYGISKTIKEVQKNAKTRYYPLELSSILKEIKNSDKKYAVVGIPSFIMELRLAATEYPEIKKSIPYMLGLICGHQKSTLYSDNLAWQHSVHPSTLTRIDYRQKVADHPASQYSIKIEGDGKVISRPQNSFYGGNWGHGFFKTKFSDYTDDALNETADVALGDAWLPRYSANSKGTNIIITRNPEIQAIIDEGIQSKALMLDVISEEEVLSSQSGLIHHTRDELPYRLWRDDERKVWRPKKRVQASSKLASIRRKVQDVREKIRDNSRSTFLRAIANDEYDLFKATMNRYANRYDNLYKLQRLKKITPKKLLRKLRRR